MAEEEWYILAEPVSIAIGYHPEELSVHLGYLFGDASFNHRVLSSLTSRASILCHKNAGL